MKTMPLVIILFLASLALCNAQDSRFSFKESYELSAPSQVFVSSSDGNIDVVAIDGKKTDVFYIVKKNNKVLNISRDELEKEITLEVKATGNSLSIVVKYKNNFNNIDWKDKMVINFRLQVPHETACNLRTSDGNVSVGGLKGAQVLGTSDGDVEVANIQGSVGASTSDGNVKISKITGSVDAKTSDGNISLHDIRGDVKAGTSDGNIGLGTVTGDTNVKTSDGDITFKDLSGSLIAKTSDGNVSGNMVKLTKELSVRTSDGNISVSIPNNLGLDLSIKGESLDVPLANFSGKSEDKSIEGKTNGGGIPVNISTSGNVSLSYK